MNRNIFLFAAICAALLLGACITSGAKASGGNSNVPDTIRIQKIGKSPNYGIDVFLLTDTETGVQYITVAKDSGVALAPRLKSDGTPHAGRKQP